MVKEYNYLIVGAGLSGVVLAERLASCGKKVLIIDKRGHIGGNCFDYIDEGGVLVHAYGPHYFRTNNEKVIRYLSKFTKWIPHKYKVKARIGNSLYSFPINLTTLEQFFGKRFKTKDEAAEFFEKLKEPISEPKNAEEQVLKQAGRELYEAFFKGYTEKQWGLEPKMLDASITARIPVRMSRDDNYIEAKFQQMPREGYTKMFENMVKSKNITLLLNTDFEKGLVGKAEKIIWTGKIDEFYKYKFGELKYRSLDFLFLTFYGKNFVQEEGQINYPEKNLPYTRIIEIKHVTHQKCKNTAICIEIPKSGGDPYYPILTEENKKLYDKYKTLADNEKDVYFCGRLATYKYLNMDQVVEQALDLFGRLEK